MPAGVKQTLQSTPDVQVLGSHAVPHQPCATCDWQIHVHGPMCCACWFLYEFDHCQILSWVQEQWSSEQLSYL